MITVSCDWCGDKQKRYKSQVKSQVFCDEDCMSKYRLDDNNGGENHPQYKRVNTSCDFCKTELILPPSVAEDGEHNFCDEDCYSSWYSEKFDEEKHPNWNGGDNDYGEKWDNKRREAVKRANGVCEHPECERVESQCGRSLDVHHIVPFRLIDNKNKANKLDNLLVLCQEHHAEVEP